jgi:hypothetical protein
LPDRELAILRWSGHRAKKLRLAAAERGWPEE